MQKVVRAFSVKSREALVKIAKETDVFTSEQKGVLAKNFDMTVESWYYQEIEGKPYVIGVAEGEQLDEGFESWGTSDDPFAVWFREQVKEMTGCDLSEAPKGPQKELIYELRP